ncbi:MAG: glycine zipper domain-containing protein [Mariprofundaceae bacterium]
MKNLFFISILALFMSACVSTQQHRAVTTGAAVGATAGAVIGSSNDRVVEGAIIGGILGAATGAVLEGNRHQPQAQKRAHTAPARVQHKHRSNHKKRRYNEEHDDDD